MLYKVFSIVIIVIPTVISLLLIISLARKYKRNKKLKDDSKKSIYWELPAIIIAFYFSITGLYFEEFSNSINDKFLNIERSIVANQHIQIISNPTISTINEEIENKIEELRNHYQHVSFIRTLNLPNPIVGKEENQDHIIGKRFLGAAFSFKYYLCYPIRNYTLNDRELDSRRIQMQDFLFQQLTLPIWRDFEGFQNKYKLHYIPFSKNYNSWTIRSSEDVECGYITFKGHWMDNYIYPERESFITTPNEELKKIILEENLKYNEIAENFYSTQLNLPTYEREPCMIFYSNHPVPSLRPITNEELSKRIDEWINLWKNELNTSKPKGLIELEIINQNLTIKE